MRDYRICILGVLAGTLDGLDVHPARKQSASEGFPLLDASIAAMETVREQLLAMGLDMQPFVSSMHDYFETYINNREQTISCIESYLLIKRIQLPARIRCRHLIKLLFLNACRHVILVNDVFSLAKEIDRM